MYAQKLAAIDGGALWGTDPVTVYDASDGSLQFGNFPPFIADGAGGAVFVWYSVGANGQVHAQHIMSDGTPAFAQNGVLASTDTSQNHFEPDGAYDPASGDIYALWRETDLQTQGQIGVYAQRIDSTGARAWGDGGKVLVPLSTVDQTEMVALPVTGGGMVAAWSSDDAPNPTPLHAARLDTDGNYVWASQIVDFSTERTTPSRLTGAVSTDGYSAYAWTANAASFSRRHPRAERQPGRHARRRRLDRSSPTVSTRPSARLAAAGGASADTYAPASRASRRVTLVPSPLRPSRMSRPTLPFRRLHDRSVRARAAQRGRARDAVAESVRLPASISSSTVIARSGATN